MGPTHSGSPAPTSACSAIGHRSPIRRHLWYARATKPALRPSHRENPSHSSSPFCSHLRHRSSRGMARKPRLHNHGGAQIDTSHGGSTSSAPELARYGPAATVCHGEAQIDSGGNRSPVSRPSTSLSVVPLLQEAKCASRSSQFLAILRSKF